MNPGTNNEAANGSAKGKNDAVEAVIVQTSVGGFEEQAPIAVEDISDADPTVEATSEVIDTAAADATSETALQEGKGFDFGYQPTKLSRHEIRANAAANAETPAEEPKLGIAALIRQKGDALAEKQAQKEAELIARLAQEEAEKTRINRLVAEYRTADRVIDRQIEKQILAQPKGVRQETLEHVADAINPILKRRDDLLTDPDLLSALAERERAKELDRIKALANTAEVASKSTLIKIATNASSRGWLNKLPEGKDGIIYLDQISHPNYEDELLSAVGKLCSSIKERYGELSKKEYRKVKNPERLEELKQSYIRRIRDINPEDRKSWGIINTIVKNAVEDDLAECPTNKRGRYELHELKFINYKDDKLALEASKLIVNELYKKLKQLKAASSRRKKQ